MKQFNVILWDFNKKGLMSYDVLPYFRKEYEELKKKDRPTTKEQWKEFIRRKGMYRFWSRCEYEILISQWPPMSDPSKNEHIKIDAWQQIENNLDLLVDILMFEYSNEHVK